MQRILLLILALCCSRSFIFSQEPKLILPIGHTKEVLTAEFSPDDKKVITVSADGTVKLWEISSGKLLSNFKPGKPGGDTSIAFLETARFSPDGKKIILSDKDEYASYAKIADINTGDEMSAPSYYDHYKSIGKIFKQFSPDGKQIILADRDYGATIYNSATEKPSGYLKGEFEAGLIYLSSWSPDGKKAITCSENDVIRIWDVATHRPQTTLRNYIGINGAAFSPNSKKILFASYDKLVLYDVVTKKEAILSEYLIGGNSQKITQFSPDGKRIIGLSGFHDAGDSISLKNYYDTVSVWDAQTGKLLYRKDNLVEHENSSFFSPDGMKTIILTNDNAVKVLDAGTGKLIFTLTTHNAIVNSARFSNDGSRIITASADSTVKIWDAETGKFIMQLAGHTAAVNDASFSKNGKLIATSSADKTAKIWDAGSGNLITNLKGRTNDFNDARFSRDGKNIIISMAGGNMIWNAETDKLIKITPKPDSTFLQALNNPKNIFISDTMDGRVNYTTYTFDYDGYDEKDFYKDLQYSPDRKFFLATSVNHNIKLFDIEARKLLYTFIAVDSADFLVVDLKNHYDGTEAARNLLYFTCGDEVIELDQVKDQLWVPNLAQRIITGDSINAKSLAELNICGLTPKVEEIKSVATDYHFKIIPRRGGLGETVLYLNGIEVMRYRPEQLQKKDGSYDLVIKKDQLKFFFVPEKNNQVMIKSRTADNAITSRGLIINENKTDEKAATPNLYAVMVGVSNYKGDDLDLTYAAKDATDISNAVAIASRNLLNIDGKEHVFMYNLTTDSTHYLLPEKNSIKKVINEIGKKAVANDILLIFFSGHGTMNGSADKKQFYFLTADASSSSATSAVADVGISTAELAEWIKPANIKAQKRILIFDACNSGQAINDIVKVGNTNQAFKTAKGDEAGQQIKAIEKLNDQSGLFILSASATDQSAYEMGRYSQGLLTYSLLKAIKQQPDILELGKYLDVSRWLNAAKETVSILVSETGERQEPQLNSSNNFTIGMVDEGVRSKIVLSEEKPLFARSNFQNADTKIDNIKLRSAIDKELMSISNSGSDAAITYSAGYEGTDAYALTGDYKISGDNIIVSVLLTRGETEILQRYETKGTISDLNLLVTSITTTIIDWLKKKK